MAPSGLRKPSAGLLRTLSDNVRAYRRTAQLSQEALAGKCGLHRTYIGAVERGERNVSLSTLEILSEALGTTVTGLLTPVKVATHDK